MSIQIFLAHASEDKAAVLDLYDRLKSKGYKPWLDKKDLIPGQNWRKEIPKAIKNSQIFIACLSQRSVSKQGYVRREFRLALNEYAEKTSDTIYLIPLKFDECEMPDLELEQLGVSMSDIHWLDYWEPDGFENLVRAIEYQYGQLESREIEKAKPSPSSDQQLSPPNPGPIRRTQTGAPPPKPASTFEYEVVTVDSQGQVKERQKRQSEYRTEGLGEGVGLDLVKIPGGAFQMGPPKGEGFDDERPQHRVAVGSFWMGKYPVTQVQWKVVAGFAKVERDLAPDPSNFKGDNRPVEQVRWDDAIEFCQRLSQKTGREYRLPSEAEWEYACRAGTTTPFHFGETISADLANYDGSYTYGSGPKGEYRQETTPVDSFKVANAFGLYDMHGNVWEWCQDCWHENYEGTPSDGSAWLFSDESNFRIRRGGSWNDDPRFCRSAYRSGGGSDDRYDRIGFRVCCSAPRSLP